VPFARITCRAQVGLRAPRVDVEVHLGAGLPCFNIVGLPATEVKESKERVRAALVNSGFEFPAGRITVNLAPADLPKDGGRFDLAIAVGMLIAGGQIRPTADLDSLEFLGELGLAGDLRAVRGALPAAAAAAAAGHRVVLPQHNAAELRWLPGVSAAIATDLLEVIAWLQGGVETPTVVLQSDPSAAEAPGREAPGRETTVLLADVCGQSAGKAALEVAAAGGHSMLLVGPPGCGKSMLAERLPGLLPPPSLTEALEIAMIASLNTVALANPATPAASGDLPRRPFRRPHHTASASAIIGGGPGASPGEITLAHHGILFLDELPEFDRRVLEALREPLETGQVSVTRANAQADYPAGFQLIAAMNPCPCGYYGTRSARCLCKPPLIERYRSRLSGPLLDRLDLRVVLEAVGGADLAEHRRRHDRREALAAEQSTRERIAAARACQLERQGCLNARLGAPRLAATVRLARSAQRFLLTSPQIRAVSLRSQDRLLRVARSVADLREAAEIEIEDLTQALALRLAFAAAPTESFTGTS